MTIFKELIPFSEQLGKNNLIPELNKIQLICSKDNNGLVLL